MTTRQAVILAGGLATRMLPRTADLPKILLPVAGRPFVDWLLPRLVSCGLDRVVLCVGHLADQVRDHVGGGSRYGADLHIVDEGSARLGTGGALALAARQGRLDDEFLVTYGDSYLTFDYAGPLCDLERTAALDGVMAVFQNDSAIEPSNAEVSETSPPGPLSTANRCGREGEERAREDSPGETIGRHRSSLPLSAASVCGGEGDRGGEVSPRLVVRYEKNTVDPRLRWIDHGATALRRSVIEHAASTLGPVFGLDVVQRDLARAGKLGAHVATERFHEIGSPAGLAELEDFLSRSSSLG